MTGNYLIFIRRLPDTEGVSSVFMNAFMEITTAGGQVGKRITVPVKVPDRTG